MFILAFQAWLFISSFNSHYFSMGCFPFRSHYKPHCLPSLTLDLRPWLSFFLSFLSIFPNLSQSLGFCNTMSKSSIYLVWCLKWKFWFLPPIVFLINLLPLQEMAASTCLLRLKFWNLSFLNNTWLIHQGILPGKSPKYMEILTISPCIHQPLPLRHIRSGPKPLLSE